MECNLKKKNLTANKQPIGPGTEAEKRVIIYVPNRTPIDRLCGLVVRVSGYR